MTAIKIFCDKSSHVVKGFEVSGHAESAEYGSDIVCASVSVLAVNTQNAIEKFCQDSFEQKCDEETVYMKFLIIDTPSHDASLLLASAYLGFEGIAEEYDNFVTLRIKEV